MRASARLPTGPSRRPLLSSGAPSLWPAVGEGAPAGPSCRLASPRLGAGAGPVPGRPGNGVPGAALRSPPRSAAALTHPTHAHSWPEAMLRSGGGRAGTGTHYCGQVARPPPRPCTRGAHARAPHASPPTPPPPHTRPEHTYAHTQQAQPSARCQPPRHRWAPHLPTSVVTPVSHGVL